ncbi:hypothetical protein M3J09_007659 [Ascochyta lentis]
MLDMQISRSGSKPSIQGPSTIKGAFIGGDVYVDPVHAADGLNVSNVNFSPCARTHWHTLAVSFSQFWLGQDGCATKVRSRSRLPPAMLYGVRLGRLTGMARMKGAIWFTRRLVWGM